MSQVRVGDVARALGVSTGLVFYHFDTKDALFVAALEFAVERDLARLDRTLARGEDSVDRLRRVIAAVRPHRLARRAGRCGSTPGPPPCVSPRSGPLCVVWTIGGVRRSRT